MTLQIPLLTETRADVKDFIEASFLFGAVGDDNTTPTTGDTTLGNETFRDSMDSFDKTSQEDKITSSLIIGTTENNSKNIKEYGVFKLTTNGTMYVHDLVNTLAKTSDIQLYLDTILTVDVVEVT